jgi:hypothetical protein
MADSNNLTEAFFAPLLRKLKQDSQAVLRNKGITGETIGRLRTDLNFEDIQFEFLDQSWMLLEHAIDHIEHVLERRLELEDQHDAKMAELGQLGRRETPVFSPIGPEPRPASPLTIGVKRDSPFPAVRFAKRTQVDHTPIGPEPRPASVEGRPHTKADDTPACVRRSPRWTANSK